MAVVKSLARAVRSHRKKLAVVLGVILALSAADYLVGMKQEAIIKEREAKKERLEKLAFFMVFPDIHDAWDIGGEPEEYEAVIKVDNVADEPVYITHPQVRAYVQTGTYWVEVPVNEKEGEPKEQIYKLDTGQYLFRKRVTIDRDLEYTAYLMPLYMHVRFHISMFVLPESVYKEEEVIERYTDVYIYLKPYFISDSEILEVLTFPDDKVPVQIPMPPH